MVRGRRRVSAVVPGMVLCSMLAACTHLPLMVMDDRGSVLPVPQVRNGKHVVIDLRVIAAGNGTLVLMRQGVEAWPKVITIRLSPGAVSYLNIQGTYQMYVPIQSTTQPVDLTVTPKLYSKTTPQITIAYYR